MTQMKPASASLSIDNLLRPEFIHLEAKLPTLRDEEPQS
jgi:hypothetical protein